MSAEIGLDKELGSLRRAIKCMSVLALIVLFARTVYLLLMMRDSERFWMERMGETEPPWGFWVYGLSRGFQNLWLLLSPVVFVIFTILLVTTVRSRTGLFLYLNGGISIVLLVLNSFLMGGIVIAYRTPWE